ncbi:MAG: hypothetical protein K6F33_11485 [Bacteroidales bacterium]|nr:hypothetical protein [Bacteroidales bacterium]
MKKWIFAMILLLGAATVLPSCDILLGTTTTNTNGGNTTNRNTNNNNNNNNSNTNTGGSNTSRGKVVK